MRKLNNGLVYNIKTDEVGVLKRQYYKDYENQKNLTGQITDICGGTKPFYSDSIDLEKEHDWADLPKDFDYSGALRIRLNVYELQIAKLFDEIGTLYDHINNASIRFN